VTVINNNKYVFEEEWILLCAAVPEDTKNVSNYLKREINLMYCWLPTRQKLSSREEVVGISLKERVRQYVL
jgi:hypothetical protein